VKLRTPSAQSDGVIKACTFQHIGFLQLLDAIDVTALARAEGGSGYDQVRIFTPSDGADDVEVGPSLLSTPNFCPADAFGVARVINLAGEVGDNVVGERHAHHEGPVFGQRSDAV
jgi:hypothetical protein